MERKGFRLSTQVTPKDDSFFSPHSSGTVRPRTSELGFREWCGYIAEKEKVTEPLGQSIWAGCVMKSYQ